MSYKIIKVYPSTKKKLLKRKKHLEKKLGIELSIPKTLEIIMSNKTIIKKRKRRKYGEVIVVNEF